ncbi:MAG TPA: glycoside hydrolase family 125 protein [Beutenbergiaceae bacterium]|nr:glycoside hydrolase family 125 protein [Beutenbergiaceae bacterium]
MSTDLTTFAPTVTDTASYHPTGNLLVALPEIDDQGCLRSLNVVSHTHRGVIEARGNLLTPVLQIGDRAPKLELAWGRENAWIPQGFADTVDGHVQVRFIPSLGQRYGNDAGFCAQLTYRNTTNSPQNVRLGWQGQWEEVAIRQFRPTTISVEFSAVDDAWMGTRCLTALAPTPIMAIAWRGGPGLTQRAGNDHGWDLDKAATVAPGETLQAEVFIGVGTEMDGASACALHLRRVGADTLRASANEWLAQRSLVTGQDGVDQRLNLNLFFNYFYAQATTIDSAQPVMLTSRSPRYYVSGALWSRDAFMWSFPAILLTDATRAREVLVETIGAAGQDIAHHALYITGGRLYPGFELDELVAPIIALGRYIAHTQDDTVLHEPAIANLRKWVPHELELWRGDNGLYATFLLPTDDPTTHPYVTTNNALAAVALDLLAQWGGPGHLAERAADVRHHLHQRCRTPQGWAWAVDDAGTHQWREEPPLSLRTLAYWGACDEDDSAFQATLRWLITDYDHHYDGAFPGAGAPHFPAPSGFDLANRLVTGNTDLGEPLAQFSTAPLDNGIGCESWDPDTGVVHTGAGMASMAGFLAWTAWAAHQGHRHWQDPLRRS